MIVVRKISELKSELDRTEGSVGHVGIKNVPPFHAGHNLTLKTLVDNCDISIVQHSSRHNEHEIISEGFSKKVRVLSDIGVDFIFVREGDAGEEYDEPAHNIIKKEGYNKCLRSSWDIIFLKRSIANWLSIKDSGLRINKKIDSFKSGPVRYALKHFRRKYLDIETIPVPLCLSEDGGVADRRAERFLSEEERDIYVGISKAVYSDDPESNIKPFTKDNVFDFAVYKHQAFGSGTMVYCIAKFGKAMYQIHRLIGGQND